MNVTHHRSLTMTRPQKTTYRAISPRTGAVFTRQSFRPYTHAAIHFTSAATHRARALQQAAQHEEWAARPVAGHGATPEWMAECCEQERANAARYRERAAQAQDTEEVTFHSSESLARGAKSYADSVTVVVVCS